MDRLTDRIPFSRWILHSSAVRAMRKGAAVLLMVMLFAGCSTANGHRTSSSTTSPSGLYGLPTDGWQTGDAGLNALTSGAFHADRRGDLGCAWIGSDRSPFLWPQGYHLRFDPTELLASNGDVVAREGERVQAGGGYVAVSKSTPCLAKGNTTWAVESAITKAP